jgi:oligopeptide transport system substrate-binding protein
MTSKNAHFSKLRITIFLLVSLVQSAWSATVHRGLGPEPDSLNIHRAQGLAAINLLRDLREGLITFDQEGEPVAGQASSWQVLDGGTRYRFRLREDARWSNGDPVLAADFLRGWQRAFDVKNPAITAGLLQGVLNAEAVIAGNLAVSKLGIRSPEPGIVEVLLKEPAPWLLEILAHPVSYPLHSDSLDDPRQAPVNGAYTLTEWVPRSTISLQRNPAYHAASSVSVEAIEYLPIEEPAAELSRYRAGELEITETIPAGRFEWLRQNLAPDLRIHPYLGSFWLGINFRHPSLGHSTDLRRALALAINRETLVRIVLGAGELPAWSIVPPGIVGYEPALMKEVGWSQQQREAEAVRLFKRAGFGGDEPLMIELRYNTSGIHRRTAVAVSAMWKQVLGVLTQLRNEEWKVFVNNRRMGIVTEVFRGGWIADYADPTSFLDLFIGGSSLNAMFYDNPRYTQLMNAADISSGAARMDQLHQAEALLIQDMPVIPLYYYVSRHLVNPRITGFSDNIRDIHLSRYLGWQTEGL